MGIGISVVTPRSKVPPTKVSPSTAIVHSNDGNKPSCTYSTVSEKEAPQLEIGTEALLAKETSTSQKSACQRTSKAKVPKVRVFTSILSERERQLAATHRRVSNHSETSVESYALQEANRPWQFPSRAGSLHNTHPTTKRLSLFDSGSRGGGGGPSELGSSFVPLGSPPRHIRHRLVAHKSEEDTAFSETKYLTVFRDSNRFPTTTDRLRGPTRTSIPTSPLSSLTSVESTLIPDMSSIISSSSIRALPLADAASPLSRSANQSCGRALDVGTYQRSEESTFANTLFEEEEGPRPMSPPIDPRGIEASTMGVYFTPPELMSRTLPLETPSTHTSTNVSRSLFWPPTSTNKKLLQTSGCPNANAGTTLPSVTAIIPPIPMNKLDEPPHEHSGPPNRAPILGNAEVTADDDYNDFTKLDNFDDNKGGDTDSNNTSFAQEDAFSEFAPWVLTSTNPLQLDHCPKPFADDSTTTSGGGCSLHWSAATKAGAGTARGGGGGAGENDVVSWVTSGGGDPATETSTQSTLMVLPPRCGQLQQRVDKSNSPEMMRMCEDSGDLQSPMLLHAPESLPAIYHHMLRVKQPPLACATTTGDSCAIEAFPGTPLQNGRTDSKLCKICDSSNNGVSSTSTNAHSALSHLHYSSMSLTSAFQGRSTASSSLVDKTIYVSVD